MLSRLCTARSIADPLIRTIQNIPQRNIICRNYAREAPRVRTARSSQPTIKEQILRPAGEGAYNFGKGAVAAGAALGLGALCFYGLGLGSGTGAIDNQLLWPQYVRDRIRSTYMYFGGSIALTAASAAAVFRSPRMMNLVTKNGWMAILGTFALMIGSGTLAQSIPYKPGFGAKQAAWMLHTAVLGAVIAPLCFMGGPILIRAGWYTAGIVGGLSTVAVCAPSEKFLYMGGPLAIGLGIVFASSLATMFLPATTALGAGLHSLSLYGGLLLFSGFLLYDTQRIIAQAEHWPPYGARPYDPVNAAMSIYLDTINIFVRLVTILSGGGGNQRRK